MVTASAVTGVAGAMLMDGFDQDDRPVSRREETARQLGLEAFDGIVQKCPLGKLMGTPHYSLLAMKAQEAGVQAGHMVEFGKYVNVSGLFMLRTATHEYRCRGSLLRIITRKKS